MKRIAYLMLMLTLLSCSGSKVNLHFRKDGTFKVCQFTDIHWDEKTGNGIYTAATIKSVLEAEKPDIAVLTGDVVEYKPAVEGWKSVIKIFEEAKQPFVFVPGNHDSEIIAKDSIFNMLMACPYYVGDKGPSELKGCGNNALPVYGYKSRKPKAVLYMVDSNTYPQDPFYSYYDWIGGDQVRWYCDSSKEFREKNGGEPLPSLMFMHIQLPEHYLVEEGALGLPEMRRRYSDTESINPGMMRACIENGDVMAVSVGHMHSLNYIGLYKRIALSFGRVTGYDAHGSLPRGGRIFTLFEGRREFESYVVTPAGREDVFYFPSGINSKQEREMEYLQAASASPSKNGVSYEYYEGRMASVADLDSASIVEEGVMPEISIEAADAEDFFGYIFKSYIKIPAKGIYRFYLHSDDGAVLSIDGRLVVDNDGSHSASRKYGLVGLEEGFHQLELRYIEDYMGQELELGIASKTLQDKPVPAEMLFVE